MHTKPAICWTVCPRCKKHKREISSVDGEMFMHCKECNNELEESHAQNWLKE